MVSRRWSFVLRAALAAMLVSLSPAAGISAALAQPSPMKRGRPVAENTVLSRIMAPCHWTETLDRHDCPEAETFRAEIHKRLVAGETPQAIEDDYVARYGPRVLAAKPGVLGPTVAFIVIAGFFVAGIGFMVWVARSGKGAQAEAGATPPGTPDAPNEKGDDPAKAKES